MACASCGKKQQTVKVTPVKIAPIKPANIKIKGT